MFLSTGKKSRRFLVLFLLAAVLYLVLNYRQCLQNFTGKTKSQKEVKTKEKQLEAPFLLIDTDCYKRMMRNEKCLSPLKVASWAENTTDTDLLVEYELETSNRHNYYILHGVTKRLLPEIKTVNKEVDLVGGNKVLVSVAEDVQIFLNYFRNSRFMESLKLPMNRNDTKRLIPLKKAQYVLRQMHRRMENISKELGTPVTAFLCGGTSLGWYREDGIITHTHDMDFAMKYEDIKGHSDKFIHLFESSFEMRDQIGFANSSLELRFTVDGVLVDLFIQYHDLEDPKKRDYVPGTNMINKEFRWYFPHTKEICTGSLLDSIVFVPCNLEDILVALYGRWKNDKPNVSGYVVVHRVFSGQEAKNMIKYYTHKP